eukprot:6201592-Pleurochrysis_carterae.AAC.2
MGPQNWLRVRDQQGLRRSAHAETGDGGRSLWLGRRRAGGNCQPQRQWKLDHYRSIRSARRT